MAMALGIGQGLKGVRDRALLLLGLAGAFRRSELVALNCEDTLPYGLK
jgi:site-specific recombinase XerD